MIRVRSFLLLISTLITVTGPTNAATTATDIQRAADRHMQTYRDRLLEQYNAANSGAEVNFRITALDNRLALADCNQPIDVDDNSQKAGNRINLKVSCKGSTPWSIYVPVTLEVLRPVVVANRPIARGERIHSADLHMLKLDTAQLSGAYFSDINVIAGQEARRLINTDEVIYDHAVEPPIIVKRGESVTITAQAGGLSVRMTAVAMSDGRRGDKITVKNPQSKRVLEATVSAPGQVTVAL